MSENNETQNNNSNLQVIKGCLLVAGIAICGFILFVLLGILLVISDKDNPDKTNVIDSRVISKETFKGNWVFNIDNVKIHHVYATGSKVLDGVEVDINNKKYALTRNITDKEFLPNTLWLDAPTRDISGYKVCDEVMLDENTCKKSLLDVINYAEKLPIEQ